jgi:isopenicillin N synthase-like dioxygenase
MRGRVVGKSHDASYQASLQESYAVGRIQVPDDPYFFTKEAGHSFAPNIWPDSPADFEAAMSEYYNEMARVYRLIMRLFDIALDLPETYFDAMIEKHGSLLRLTHYPALDAAPAPGEYRSGAHTDGGALTILHIDDTPDSLQVKLRSGEWINVNRVPGTFVINIGDMMMRWTNDKWTSNWHQVVNPKVLDGKSDRRLSLVYFCSTNYDTIVECLPNCSGPGNPARYPPVNSGQFAADRFNRRYGIEQPAAKQA